ncbi:MAG: hypothetical protein ACRDD1_10840 [Planctomycetia bacterium]
MTTAESSSARLADDARRGQEAFDRLVKPKLRPEDDGKFVAVDIDSGDYEIDADDYQATGRLMERVPGARIWLLRAGRPTTYRIVRLGLEGRSQSGVGIRL